MATPIWQWSAVDTAAAIRERRLSAEQVVQAHIDRLRAVNPGLNAVVVDLSKTGTRRRARRGSCQGARRAARHAARRASHHYSLVGN